MSILGYVENATICLDSPYPMQKRQKFSSKIPQLVPTVTGESIARSPFAGLAYRLILEPSALVSDTAAFIRELVVSKRVLKSTRSEVWVDEELA